MSVTFNGTDSKITAASVPSAGFPYSMFAWVKPSTTSQSTFPFGVGKYDVTSSQEELAIYCDGTGAGKMRSWNVALGAPEATSSTTGVATTWQPVLVVFTSSSVVDVYYAGGAKVTGNPGQTPNFAAINRLAIGTRAAHDSLWFSGDIAEVAIWSTSLIASDFTTLSGDVHPETVESGSVVFHASLLTHTDFGSTAGPTLTGAGTLATGATHPITRSATPAPTVTTQPSSSTVTEGATAAFTAAFANTPTSWAWEYAVSPYSSWSAVSGGSGGTTTEYTTASTTLAMTGRRYRCTATNAGGSVTTNGAAELTVNAVGPDLSSPTVTSVGATTATCGFSTDTATGNGYFLRRTGLSAASAATIIGTGESQAISGTGAQTRAMTAFTSGLTYYVDMAQTGSTEVVTAGPFYPGTGRPVSDVDVTGWTASTGSDLWAMLDEDTASDADYVTSPALSGSATTGSHALDKTYTAGTYSIKVRAKTDTGAGTLAVRLLNGSNVSQGVTADQAITSTWTTYTLPITITGDATRIRYEVVAA